MPPVSDTIGPTPKAHLQVRQMMVELNIRPVNTPRLMIGRAEGAFDSKLRLTDEKAKAALQAAVEALVTRAERIREP